MRKPSQTATDLPTTRITTGFRTDFRPPISSNLLYSATNLDPHVYPPIISPYFFISSLNPCYYRVLAV